MQLTGHEIGLWRILLSTPACNAKRFLFTFNCYPHSALALQVIRRLSLNCHLVVKFSEQNLQQGQGCIKLRLPSIGGEIGAILRLI